MPTYDHIVIGAGSAGCAAAERLSADSSRSVLLLEAGGSDLSLAVRAPAGFGNQFHTKLDWGYHSEPEPACADRRMHLPRGRMLGGSSSMNAMLWVRGCEADYDGWGVNGWSWEECLPYFKRMESHYLGGDEHGRTGPVRISRAASTDSGAQRFVDAAVKAGIPASEDIGGPRLEGVAIPSVSVWQGQRWSTARAYLDRARRRKNHTLVKNALVRRVVVRDGRAVGVEFEHKGRVQTAAARGDVVVSAGAYGTPQLLQLSGIGPADHLRSVGIEPLVSSPLVGAGLADHPLTMMNWEVSDEISGLFDVRHPKWLLRWLFGRSGKLTSNLVEAMAHVRSDPGLSEPDFQFIFAPAYMWDGGQARHSRPAFMIGQSYWTPRSQGSVLVRSSDPREAPAILMNMLSERGDVEAIIRAVRLTREIVAQEPLARMVRAELHPGEHVRSEEDLEKWIRETAWMTYHAACTASMGSDADSVLDERLRVRGVAGLRVADASALPRIPRSNTNAPAILFGERCADFIREDGWIVSGGGARGASR